MKKKAYCVFGVGVLLVGCSSSGGSGKNCSDFQTQPEAQRYFIEHNATNLDRDNDGIACESLPDSERLSLASDFTEFVGEYYLLGEECGVEGCSAKAAYLDVKSESNVELCLSSNLEFGCENHIEAKGEISVEENRLVIDGGNLIFGSTKSGHLKLSYRGGVYFGQNVLKTNYDQNGDLLQNGIFVNEGRYELTSNNGQKVIWDESGGLELLSE